NGPPEHDGPGEEERHFNIEDDEEQCHDVIAQIKLHPGAADGRFAALIDGELFRVGPSRPDDTSDDQVNEDEEDPDAQEQHHNCDEPTHSSPHLVGAAQRCVPAYRGPVSTMSRCRPANPASNSCQCATSGSPSRQQRYTSRSPIQQGKSISPVR